MFSRFHGIPIVSMPLKQAYTKMSKYPTKPEAKYTETYLVLKSSTCQFDL